MRNFKRTDQAEQDLIEIWLHIARDKPSAAEKFLERIDGACARLAQNPRMGPARPDLAADLRYFVVGAYLIYTAKAMTALRLCVLYMAR